MWSHFAWLASLNSFFVFSIATAPEIFVGLGKMFLVTMGILNLWVQTPQFHHYHLVQNLQRDFLWLNLHFRASIFYDFNTFLTKNINWKKRFRRYKFSYYNAIIAIQSTQNPKLSCFLKSRVFHLQRCKGSGWAVKVCFFKEY